LNYLTIKNPFSKQFEILVRETRERVRFSKEKQRAVSQETAVPD